MMQPNRMFFPQALLDTWLVEEKVELSGHELFLHEEKQKFNLQEAVRILQGVAGTDHHQLVGKVKTRAQLETVEAEVLEDSMIIGDDAYEVIPGFVGELVQSSQPRSTDATNTSNNNDEDLLASFLLKEL